MCERWSHRAQEGAREASCWHSLARSLVARQSARPRASLGGFPRSADVGRPGGRRELADAGSRERHAGARGRSLQCRYPETRTCKAPSDTVTMSLEMSVIGVFDLLGMV